MTPVFLFTHKVFLTAMRLLVLIASLVLSLSSYANVFVPKAPSLDAKAYILLDAASGKVLVEHNADQRIAPASLTKMMTSYVAIHELELGNVEEQTPIPISVKAWKMGGSKMFVREGTQVPLIDLLRGIVIQSGNDASVAVAEYFSGSESSYAEWMNQYAKRFGMTNTHFVNVTGWPAQDHYTSARDMATLSLHIINDHKKYYGLYAEKYYTYNDIRQPNRNSLLWRDPSVDGLKTGHTDEAGYCLAASAKKEETRLIAVVMGARSDAARATETQKLLAYGFRYFETRQLYDAGKVLETAKVWMGQSNQVELKIENDLYLTVPRGLKSELDTSVVVEPVIKAPIEQGQVLGKLVVRNGSDVIAEHPLVASQAIEEAGFFGRLWDSIKLYILGLFS